MNMKDLETVYLLENFHCGKFSILLLNFLADGIF